MYPRTGSSERSPRRWVSPPRRTRTSHLNQGDPGDLSAWAIASFLSPLIHRSAWKGYSPKFVYENLHDLTSSQAENGRFHRPGINPRHKMLCCWIVMRLGECKSQQHRLLWQA